MIAHRGAPRDRRENTLPSFARALEAGADAIELDVHATSDGVVVVHHDASVRNVNGSLLSIHETSFTSLNENRDSATRVPALAEVLELVAARGTVYVEIKAPAIEALVIAAIRNASTAAAVHSFDHRIVRRVGELAPEIPRGILQTSYLVDPVIAMRPVGARDLWQHWELLDQELVNTIHVAGRRVIAWTVNDLSLAQQLASWGVDGICSDIAGELGGLRLQR